MIRRFIFCFVLMGIASFSGFGQQASIMRDYVGMISQGFHPDMVSFLERFRDRLNSRGYDQAVRSLDIYLKGDSGTGFAYVAGGRSYIITNFHVISQAETLSITFEKPDGERTRYTGLTIVAADEDMDIALLAFPEGQRPFTQGLSFLSRTVQEGENVLSAGFPRLGSAMIWQLGAGIVSNASVRLPLDDGTDKMIGPFIQHTAQIDPGNSGGPLLVQTAGVPSGYSVAGINTLSAIRRQGTNFAIPMNRARSFLDASLAPPAGDGLTRLNARIDAFIEGLGSPRAVYPHIADYLSNACTGENVDYAMGELFSKAPRTTLNAIVEAFFISPVDGMTYSVAWLIENNLRTKSGAMSTVTKESVTPSEDGRYKVTFNVNGKPMDSEWVNEYGIWRIRSFGNFLTGDKTLVEKRKKEATDAANLRANPSAQIAVGYTHIIDRGSAVGVDLIFRGEFSGYGLHIYFAKNFFQIDGVTGFYFPIKAGTVAFTPFIDIGAGVQFKTWTDEEALGGFQLPDFGLSLKPGLQFTTAGIPGLYFQAAYQFNLMFFGTIVGSAVDAVDASDSVFTDRHMISFSIGYSF